jgi:hypothetical protein
VPYTNPEDKRAWEEAHRSDRKKRLFAATRWADEQIKMLKSMGVVHSPAEWRRLRNDLRKSRLGTATLRSLQIPTTQ